MGYDYLIIGAGLTGAVLAHELNKRNKKVLVVDKRSHIGGNCYTDTKTSIIVHYYGAHIFHTDKK
jgi:UDP-galactopyranose mutase